MVSITTFIILFVFWIIWSGKFDAFHLVLGVISTLIVTLWSRDLLIAEKDVSFGQRLKEFIRFELYSFWLLYEIVLANIHVVRIAFRYDLKSALEPKMIEFDTSINNELGQFLLAQSITLTPGTVTVRIDDKRFLVHALTKDTSVGIPGKMQTKIASIFKKGKK